MDNTILEHGTTYERGFLAKASCLLKDGTIVEFDRTNLMAGGVTISDGVTSSNKFELGAAIINQLTVMVYNGNEEFSGYDFTDAVITVWLGIVTSGGVDWVKKGVFNASDPTTTPDVITLKALDNMCKFDAEYDGKLNFPCTLQTVAQYCCGKCGVLLLNGQFTNHSYIIQKNPFTDTNKITYRAIISYCALMAGCFARCNVDGRLEFKWFDMAAFNEGNKFSARDIRKFSSLSVATKDIVITGIRVTASDSKSGEGRLSGETYLCGVEGYILEVKDNPLIEFGKAKVVAEFLASKVVGMKFRPMTASCVGAPSWEAGDVAVLTDRKGSQYNCLLTNLTHVVGNYISISCDAEAPTRHSADRYSQVEQIIANIKNDTRYQLSEYGKYLEQMNQLAVNAMGYYETVEKNDDGSVITYMHDKPLLSDSMIVYKKSIDGYFWSKDGGKTWTGGIDKDGNAVMNVIAAIGLRADWIDSGRIQVKDDDGNIVFLVDMDTKQIIISGDSVMIGGKTVTEAINNVKSDATALSVSLSNEYQGIPVDSKGNYTTINASSAVTVRYGSTDVSADCSYSIAKSTGVVGTWNASKRTYTLSGLNSDTGWVDITATYLKLFTATKRFNVAKTKDGAEGAPGRSYYLEASDSIIKYTKNNLLSPDFIDFSAYYQQGEVAGRKNYQGRFKIEESINGEYFETIYTSGQDESSVRHFLNTILVDAAGNGLCNRNGFALGARRNITHIRCKLYASGGVTSLVDTVTVTVLKDVDALTHNEIFNLLTNNGIVKGIYQEGNQLYINATYTATGILTDVNRNNYWNLDTGDFRLSSTATVGGKTVDRIAQDKVNGQTQEEVFNKLTSNGAMKGIYMSNGQLYISFTYAKGGTLTLGGVGNGNGILSILDSSGNRVGYIDNTGVNFNKGTFSGELSAAKGTFAGNLSAAKGTFSGELSAASGSFSGTISNRNSNGGGLSIGSSVLYFYGGGLVTMMLSSSDLWLKHDTGTGLKYRISNTDSALNNLTVHGRFSAAQNLSELVETRNYGTRMMCSFQTATPYIGDIGTAETDENGICFISIDDVLGETVSTDIEYSVFLQKEGPGDIWVKSKDSSFFVVEGTPNLKFSWEMKAVYEGYEMNRLEDYNLIENNTDFDTQDIDDIFYSELVKYDNEMEELFNESIESFSGD